MYNDFDGAPHVATLAMVLCAFQDDPEQHMLEDVTQVACRWRQALQPNPVDT